MLNSLQFFLALSLAPRYLSALAFAGSTCNPTQSTKASCGVAGQLKPQYDGYGPAAYNNIYGPPIDYELGQASYVDNVQQCAELCLRRRDYCLSFYFDNISNFCQLGSFHVAKASEPAPKSHLDFYDAECFDCGPKCPQPLHKNILDNGDFEGRLLGPWESYSGQLRAGHDSKRGFYCHPTSDFPCRLYQHENECYNAWYRFQFDWKAIPDTNKSYDLHATVGSVNNIARLYQATQIVSSGKKGQSQDWTTAYGFFKNGRNRLVGGDPFEGPVIKFGEDTQYYVDNFEITRFPSNWSGKSGTEALKNGGFEDGKLHPWTVDVSTSPSGNFTLYKPGINSSTALTFVLVDPNYGVSPSLKQKFSTKPRTTYLFSFDIENETGPYWITMAIHFDDLRYELVATKGKTTYSIPVYAPSNNLEISVELFGAYYIFNKRGKFLIDNFSIKELVIG